MTIMITGGSGFVGLNVAEALLSRGGDVLLFSLASPPAAALSALGHGPGRLTVLEGDVVDRPGIVAALREYRVTRIVHGAAITADAERERVAARRIAEVNVLGTIEVLEAALAAGVGRIVQLGTGSVFGLAGTAAPLLDECAVAPVPETLYGITKYAAERIGLRYRALRGLDVVVARLGVVFGRWEYATGVRDTLSIPLQLTAIAESGGEARFPDELPDDWVYATDVAHGILALLDASAVRRPLYHLASGTRWSVVDWCNRLQREFPRFRFAQVQNAADCNVGRSTPRPRSPMSIAAIQQDYGYKPVYMMDQAFEDFIAWRREVKL